MATWSWPDAFFPRLFGASVGACPGGGVDKTVMVVYNPNGNPFGLLAARNGGSNVWAIFQDAGKLFFGTGDFTGGPTRVAGEWMQAAARFTASTNKVNWRSRVTSGGGAAWAGWGNIADYNTGEGGTTIDNLLIGQVFGDLANGAYAVCGVWNSKLADATIDGLGVNVPLWRASGATIYQFNALHSPPVAGDLVDITGGGANGTSYTTGGGNVTLTGADPPGIVYWTPSSGPGAAFLPLLT